MWLNVCEILSISDIIYVLISDIWSSNIHSEYTILNNDYFLNLLL